MTEVETEKDAWAEIRRYLEVNHIESGQTGIYIEKAVDPKTNQVIEEYKQIFLYENLSIKEIPQVYEIFEIRDKSKPSYCDELPESEIRYEHQYPHDKQWFAQRTLGGEYTWWYDEYKVYKADLEKRKQGIVDIIEPLPKIEAEQPPEDLEIQKKIRDIDKKSARLNIIQLILLGLAVVFFVTGMIGLNTTENWNMIYVWGGIGLASVGFLVAYGIIRIMRITGNLR